MKHTFSPDLIFICMLLPLLLAIFFVFVKAVLGTNEDQAKALLLALENSAAYMNNADSASLIATSKAFRDIPLHSQKIRLKTSWRGLDRCLSAGHEDLHDVITTGELHITLAQLNQPHCLYGLQEFTKYFLLQSLWIAFDYHSEDYKDTLKEMAKMPVSVVLDLPKSTFTSYFTDEFEELLKFMQNNFEWFALAHPGVPVVDIDRYFGGMLWAVSRQSISTMTNHADWDQRTLLGIHMVLPIQWSIGVNENADKLDGWYYITKRRFHLHFTPNAWISRRNHVLYLISQLATPTFEKFKSESSIKLRFGIPYSLWRPGRTISQAWNGFNSEEESRTFVSTFLNKIANYTKKDIVGAVLRPQLPSVCAITRFRIDDEGINFFHHSKQRQLSFLPDLLLYIDASDKR